MDKNNTPKVSVFIATSLDGFISREDGSIDWLIKLQETAPQGEDCGYKEFISSIDTIIMGQNTFEQVLTFENWPYKGKDLIVLSSKFVTIPDKLKKSVTYSSNSPKNILSELFKNNSKGVYVDGGITIQSFLSDGLIDEITITTIPILLGRGKPLFGILKKDIHLELIQSKSYPFGGFIQTKYKINNNFIN